MGYDKAEYTIYENEFRSLFSHSNVNQSYVKYNLGHMYIGSSFHTPLAKWDEVA